MHRTQEPGSERRGGGRAVANTISVTSSGLRQLTRTKPKPAVSSPVQRMKLIAGEKLIHINEYHFIHLMHEAGEIGNTGKHSVVFTVFSDFNGLGVEAGKYKNQETFSFGGIKWGWNGKEELFPIDGGNDVVSLDSEFISMLSRIAKGNSFDPPQKYAQDDTCKLALKMLRSYYKSNPATEREKGTFSMPFSFSYKSLPSVVTFSPGKSKEGFVFAMGGDLNRFHLHLFLSENWKDAKDGLVTVKEIALKSRKRNHIKISAAGKLGDWAEPLNDGDEDDLNVLKAVLETLVRHGNAGAEPDEKDNENKKEDETYDKVKAGEARRMLDVFIDRSGLDEAYLLSLVGGKMDTFADYTSYTGFYDEFFVEIQLKKAEDEASKKEKEGEKSQQEKKGKKPGKKNKK